MLASKSFMGKREKRFFRESMETRERANHPTTTWIQIQAKKHFQSSNCNIVRRNRSCMRITFCRLNNCIVGCATNERIMKLFCCLQQFFVCAFMRSELRSEKQSSEAEKVNEFFIIISYCALCSGEGAVKVEICAAIHLSARADVLPIAS